VLHCLDAETGERYWTHETKHETWGGPMVADNKVYLTTKKSFWVLEAGKQKKVISHQRGLGSETPPIAANGVLYALLKGRLYALQK
jgi:outer membrane protein assembly factor BamB